MCDSLKKFKGWSLSASLNHMTFADLPFMHPALSHKAFGKHLEGFFRCILDEEGAAKFNKSGKN